MRRPGRLLRAFLCAPGLWAGGCGAPDTASLPPAGRAAADDDYEIRLWANRVRMGRDDLENRRRLAAAGPRAVPILADLLRHAPARERAGLLAVLIEIKDLSAVPHLVKHLEPNAADVHHALCRISGVDHGFSRRDWLTWWRQETARLSPAEAAQVREEFLRQPPRTQQEILRGLLRKLTIPALYLRRDPLQERETATARLIDASDLEDLRKRMAALPILEAVLDQGRPENLIYVEPLARQIGPPALAPLRAAAGAPDPAVRRTAEEAAAALAPDAGR